ncbi:MAG: hypothetical protein ABL911_02840 [Gallionella sp.]|nr:hypothetical protein [Gallionella sp.]
MDQQKLKKWNRWLGDANTDGSIAHELANLAVIREIHSGLKRMVDNNNNLQKHSAFYSVIQITYSQSVLMYIRRQVTRNKDSVSLIMLADDILKNSGMITKEFYSNLYTVNRAYDEQMEFKRFGERDFERHFGVGDCLDPRIIEHDIQNLEKISRDSSGFTDRRLAHLDKREPTNIPMYSGIESWCDDLNVILKKYMLLCRAVDYKVDPILQHDWKNIFHTAWL